MDGKAAPSSAGPAVFQPSLREPTFPVAFSLRAGKVGAQSGALPAYVGCSHSHGLLGSTLKAKLQGVWGVTQLRLSPQNLYRLEPAWSLGLVTCDFL